MGYVFISYSSKDIEKLNQLKPLFEKHNIDVWLAPNDIPVGYKYAQVISRAIKNCACFVVLLTENSLRSTWVAKEVERAVSHKRFIIPIQFGDVTLTEEFELYISTDQILPMTELQSNPTKVRELISSIKAHTKASVYEKQTLITEILNEATAEDDMQPDTPVQTAQPESNKKGLKALLGVSAGLVVLLLAIIAAITLSPLFKDKTDLSDGSIESNHTTTQNLQQITTTQTQTTTTQAQITTKQTQATTKQTQATTTQKSDVPANTGGVNQIPANLQKNVEALKHADPLTLSNQTLRVKVGEGISPSSAQLWPNAKIYSQNTSIAVADGAVIKGVSAGETYVVVSASDTGFVSVTYYVIVE